MTNEKNYLSFEGISADSQGIECQSEGVICPQYKPSEGCQIKGYCPKKDYTKQEVLE